MTIVYKSIFSERSSIAFLFLIATNTLKQTCQKDSPLAQFAFEDLMTHGFCNSHCISHFAAFFIVVGAKTSVAESVNRSFH